MNHLEKTASEIFYQKPAKFFPKVAAVSNHSARKTCITNLLNENVNLLDVRQLSGHKKLKSL